MTQQTPNTLEVAINIATVFETRRTSVKCTAAYLPMPEMQKEIKKSLVLMEINYVWQQ